MKTLLQLLVLAALGYGLWAYGMPWIKRQVGQSRAPVSNPAKGPGGSCVQLAATASEKLDDDVLGRELALREPAARDQIADEVAWSLEQARLACDCELESCAAVRVVLSSLESVLESARLPRSSQSVPLELGREYEKANEKLWEAYDLAREGR